MGETGTPEAARWRRCLTITAPTETAARARMAIRIGTSGEEPPSPPEGVGAPACTPADAELVEAPLAPLSGLLCCPVARSLLLPGTPPDFEDGFPADDAAPEEPEAEPLGVVDADALPPALDSGASLLVRGAPVAVGGASEYWTPLESA